MEDLSMEVGHKLSEASEEEAVKLGVIEKTDCGWVGICLLWVGVVPPEDKFVSDENLC